ncbi:amidohydrolase family protein [Levilactobacillus namurensis]|uniref:amidohydrolase family protein n=1 Tax=Levilactobacillus namurensis TaxID=380393 RepID=UPI00222FD809|nr:amidohydrolase family protein [Levilactobacillus namurensis]MCW3777260.1 amidohydrolase family protein [Levilactobacillus namurensis]MDT7018675.1 amidohydrolase family protein [Levilactobacillus namurensis]WNN66699.1 amidohydrolase family protein [Levilactobacillus namurensis]
MSAELVIQGSLFTPVSPTEFTFLRQALVCVDATGTIARIVRATDTDYSDVQQTAQRLDHLWQLPHNQYILPGFIDLHVHAPQWPQAGLALDRPLDQWLNTYTFPLEAKFADTAYATKVYHHLVHELLRNGTTTAMYFGTLHPDANLALARQCAQQGQRGFIGQLAMDNPDQTPATYRQASSQEALQTTERFIAQLQRLAKTTGAALTPVITPRFVPSCTAETLRGLGALAHRDDLPIQSHCSESNWEEQYAESTYHQRDAAVFDRFQLLTSRSVMAHGTQLNADDLALFADRQTTVAHCPISNCYFGNAVFPVQQALHHQVNVGLGSDLSGGFTPSLYRNLQQAVMSSQQLQDGVDAQVAPAQRGRGTGRISATTAFYLATKGGAKGLNLQTGQLRAGFAADLQIVTDRLGTLMPNDAHSVFERLMYQTTPAEISAVFVRGRQVIG